MEAIESLVTRWYTEVWTQWNGGALEEVAQEDIHVQGALGGDTKGYDQFWGHQGQIWGGFPDLSAEVSELVVEGEKATCAVTWVGTHKGHIWDCEATEKAVQFSSNVTLLMKDGKLSHIVEESDLANIRTQIGATPEPKVVAKQDQRILPTFRALDWDESRKFYVGVLGFEVIFEWRHAPHFPVFAGIRRDDINLHISEHGGDCEPGGSLSIRWPGVDDLYAELEAKGFQTEPPQDQPWGDRAFDVKDPSGNNITFFETMD